MKSTPTIIACLFAAAVLCTAGTPVTKEDVRKLFDSTTTTIWVDRTPVFSAVSMKTMRSNQFIPFDNVRKVEFKTYKAKEYEDGRIDSIPGAITAWMERYIDDSGLTLSYINHVQGKSGRYSYQMGDHGPAYISLTYDTPAKGLRTTDSTAIGYDADGFIDVIYMFHDDTLFMTHKYNVDRDNRYLIVTQVDHEREEKVVEYEFLNGVWRRVIQRYGSENGTRHYSEEKILADGRIRSMHLSTDSGGDTIRFSVQKSFPYQNPNPSLVSDEYGRIIRTRAYGNGIKITDSLYEHYTYEIDTARRMMIQTRGLDKEYYHKQGKPWEGIITYWYYD